MSPRDAPLPHPERALLAAVLAALLSATAAVYAPVLDFGFTSFDDPAMVNEPHVLQGLSLTGVAWAFTSVQGANWHPLTWLSHQLDRQLFGAWAGGHHAMSVAIHLATVVVVFLALARLTRAAWPSLAASALFALHPINLESVVWVAERKNVLSGLLFALTLLAYAGYARQPTWWRYAGVSAAFALGLLAKPMLVTLPCVLLLLDFWPLARITPATRARVVAEKLPWFLMSGLCSMLTVHAQAAAGAMETLAESPIQTRLCVAASGYVGYLEKLFWPVRFSILYPKPNEPCDTLPWQAAAVMLACLCALVLLRVRRQPYLAVGFAAFAGMLVPVSGLVQVGVQLMADRYAYQPMLGVAIAVCWTVTDLARRTPGAVRWLPPGALAVAAALAVRTTSEIQYWRDDATLFGRALAVTRENCMAHLHLGVALRLRGDGPAAFDHFEEAVRICPWNDMAQSNLGGMLANAGQFEQALPHLIAATQLSPRLPAAQYNLGLALWYRGDSQAAMLHFRQALAADPTHAPSLQMLRLIGSPNSE